MSRSVSDAPPLVKGDIISLPPWHAWVHVGFGAFWVVIGCAMIAAAIHVVLRDWPTDLPPRGMTWLFVVSGLLCTLLGAFFVYFGWWHIRYLPRWVIGSDRLLYVTGISEVRLYIPFANLAAVDLCHPGLMSASFIGLRLVHPELMSIYAGRIPAISRSMRGRFGYHWIVSQSNIPVAIVHERIQGRIQQWRADASASPASLPAPTFDTTIITSA